MPIMNIYMRYKQYYNRKIHGAYSALTAQNALISHGGSTIWQNICTHFLVARVLSAGLGWAGDYQNVLGKVGGSEMQFGGVDVHALDSGENTQCFLASHMRFMNIYMRYKQYYKRKTRRVYSTLTAQNALISHGGSTIWQNICSHFLVARV